MNDRDLAAAGSNSSRVRAAGARRQGRVINSWIDALSPREALERIVEWAVGGEARYVSICNVHAVVAASRDVDLQDAVNQADMATPDGAPIAWTLRRLGYRGQRRVAGPDLMWELCARCAERGLPVFLYGSSEGTLERLSKALGGAFPALRVVGAHAPPFRQLTEEEDASVVARVRASGASIVFVGLGCPKQELWMASHRGRLNAVLIGVGAAFDFHAGTMKRAPLWMRSSGLEWLHRLVTEPTRLWKRYLVTNSIFIVKVAHQLLFQRR